MGCGRPPGSTLDSIMPNSSQHGADLLHVLREPSGPERWDGVCCSRRPTVGGAVVARFEVWTAALYIRRVKVTMAKAGDISHKVVAVEF